MDDRDESKAGKDKEREPAPRKEESPEYWHDAPGQSDLEQGKDRPDERH